MPAFAVYVHVPFCTVKCGYCDFNAYAGMDAIKADYADAVIAEIGAWARSAPGEAVSSIGFGGGTPGEFPPADTGRIISEVGRLWPLEEGAEVSLEANPGTSGPAVLAAFREAGVTRITFGAQSFSAAELRFLDRIHSPEAITASVRSARAAGFESIGLDLIFGLPGQEESRWRENLRRALSLGPDHISCYALTVEPGTLLDARVRRAEVRMPEPDAVADLYEIARTTLQEAGFVHYEISNWARDGHQSRHNLAYWTDRPYLGLGAGAHGFLGDVRYENVAHPRAYVAAARGRPPRRTGVLAPEGTVAAVHRQPESARMVDFITLRLRLVEGLWLEDFAARFGVPLPDVAGRAVEEGRRAGIVALEDGWLRLTSRGLLLHGEFAVRLMADLEGGA